MPIIRNWGIAHTINITIFFDTTLLGLKTLEQILCVRHASLIHTNRLSGISPEIHLIDPKSNFVFIFVQTSRKIQHEKKSFYSIVAFFFDL